MSIAIILTWLRDVQELIISDGTLLIHNSSTSPLSPLIGRKKSSIISKNKKILCYL